METGPNRQVVLLVAPEQDRMFPALRLKIEQQKHTVIYSDSVTGAEEALLRSNVNTMIISSGSFASCEAWQEFLKNLLLHNPILTVIISADVDDDADKLKRLRSPKVRLVFARSVELLLGQSILAAS